jgi:PAS domain S-box-containing protein
MRAISANWLVAGTIAVACGILITVAVCVQGISTLYRAQERVSHVQEVRLSVERALSFAKDAETGQRGFLLTGDAQYLEPYRTALAAIDQQISQAEGLTEDDPPQHARVEEFRHLMKPKLDELAQTIEVRRSQGLVAAQQIVLTNRGKDAMDAARLAAARIDDVEVSHLREREAARKTDRRNAVITSLATGLVAIALCGGFGFGLRRHLALRTRTTNEISAQKELFRTTLASIGDAVITSDLNGNVIFLNAVAEGLTGWSQQDAAAKPLELVFNIINESSRQKVENPALRALREGAISGLANHTMLVARSGTETPIDDSAAPIRDALGNTIGAVLVFRDITERKAAENALLDGARRKDEFLATLAHELRNPLAPLRNALDLARRRVQKAGGGVVASEDVLAMMDRQVEQMTRLVDDLLDVARITRGKLELRVQRIEVSAIVSRALETCAPVLAQANHEVTVSMPDHPLYVRGDPTRLSQVVCNLLNNAAKYSDAATPISIKAEDGNGEIVLSVADSGMGIEPSMLEQIFQMFAQVDRSMERSKTGLGIGLTLARQIVEMHGGTIHAMSDGPGRGSTFVVRLPESGAPMVTGSSPRVANDLRRSSGAMKILIADDNKDAADSIGMLLRANGHDVQVVYNGVDAVTSANSMQPDVIVLDIGMPKLNGYDAARQIRQQAWAGRAILVALSGWGQPDDRLRAQEAGFDQHLTKPIDADALETTLHTLSDGISDRAT